MDRLAAGAPQVVRELLVSAVPTCRISHKYPIIRDTYPTRSRPLSPHRFYIKLVPFLHPTMLPPPLLRRQPKFGPSQPTQKQYMTNSLPLITSPKRSGKEITNHQGPPLLQDSTGQENTPAVITKYTPNPSSSHPAILHIQRCGLAWLSSPPMSPLGNPSWKFHVPEGPASRTLRFST